MTEIHNNHIYAGNENELLLSRIYTTSFTCDFNMALYPLDVQECNMIFILKVVENVDIYERLTRIENPEDIKEIVGIVC